MNKFKNKTILCVGCAGFIGSHLVDELLKLNPKKIIIFDNLFQSSIDNIKHLLNNEKIKFVNYDIRDSEIIKPYIMNADYLFNLSCVNMGNAELFPKLALEVNVNGVFNIMQLCLENNPNIRIIHTSSGSVVGNTEEKTNENSMLNPESHYAVSKMAGEKYALYFAKQYGLKISVVRPHHITGEKQQMNGKAGVINIFLSRILSGKAPCIFNPGTQIKCFTYVKDMVHATIMLALKDETIGQIYNVVSDNRISINKLSTMLIDKYAKDKNMKPTHGPAKIGEIMNPKPSNAKIKALGWKPQYTFEEGLDLTKQWVSEQL